MKVRRLTWRDRIKILLSKFIPVCAECEYCGKPFMTKNYKTFNFCCEYHRHMFYNWGG